MLGKKLKILHVGNIVQNAYVNASILNQRGHDCDVAAFDWYHFASSPEWYHLSEADADLDQLADHYFPDFYRAVCHQNGRYFYSDSPHQDYPL